MYDSDTFWQLDNLCHEYAMDDMDDEAFMAQLEMIAYQAIEVEMMDPSDFTELLSTAAHNANVNHPVGQMLGFE